MHFEYTLFFAALMFLQLEAPHFEKVRYPANSFV
jgi:hypothetical protein